MVNLPSPGQTDSLSGWPDGRGREALGDFGVDPVTALHALRACKTDPQAMAELQRLLASCDANTPTASLGPDDVIARAAALMVSGRIALASVANWVPSPAPAPPPAPPPPPPPPKPAPNPSPPPPPVKVGHLVVTVIDDEDNSVVKNVPVAIKGPQAAGAPSNVAGKALFNGLKPGGYSIEHGDKCLQPATASASVAADKTAAATLRVRHTHAAITIKELAYSGHNVVEKDTTGNFGSPEWVEGRAQADQFPVAYARNKKVGFTAKFKVTKSPCRPEVVEVKATATFGPAALQWLGSVTVAPGAAEVSVALTSGSALADEIGFFDSSDISWQMNPAKRGWAAAGSTRNVTYVTLGDPVTSPNYWTLLDISCRAAVGKKNEDDFVKASFLPYAGTLGDGKGFKRKRDGTELTYYKFGAGTPSKGVFTCSDILSRADGTGRCGGWARFMVAMHQVHGVTSSAVAGVVPVNATLLIVRNCAFNGVGSLSVPFTHKGQTECVKQAGIFGQGKNNPQFLFGDHALVKHSTGIYDPSYGVGPKPDLRSWEDGGIAGLGEMPGISFTFAGDPHFIPSKCSPGFVNHTVGPGETLAGVAATFGIASDAALYNHAYNAALRGKRASAAAVVPGDAVVIPRDISSKVAILKF